jgi:hypothetical protein
MHPTRKTPDPTEVTPAETLRCAALYLQRHGWIQGGYYRRRDGIAQPPACALGAIGMAVHGQPLVNPLDADLAGWWEINRAYNALNDYLVRFGYVDDNDEYEDVIATWNDETGRLSGSVIATLNLAADEWDRTHGGAR